MRRFIAFAILLAASAASPARTFESCVSLENSADIARLVHELDSLKMAHRVGRAMVCVDGDDGSAFSAVLSKLFADPSRRRHLEIPRTPSGVAAESFTFYDTAMQAALEATLRRKGIWFAKDASGTLWYEVTSEAVVGQEIFGIAESRGSNQRSDPTVETDARKSGARGAP
ncbi:MAG: hypothetical protein EPO20_16960 [Betaproteobacteria bacterium]|nr:MAG: hypothetical protein EPO20_16960 [Betaproteobacteria bacterium]